jgi:hypothetical protein
MTGSCFGRRELTNAMRNGSAVVEAEERPSESFEAVGMFCTFDRAGANDERPND